MFHVDEVWQKGNDDYSISYDTDNPNFASELGKVLELSGYECVKREVQQLG